MLVSAKAVPGLEQVSWADPDDVQGCHVGKGWVDPCVWIPHHGTPWTNKDSDPWQIGPDPPWSQSPPRWPSSPTPSCSRGRVFEPEKVKKKLKKILDLNF